MDTNNIVRTPSAYPTEVIEIKSGEKYSLTKAHPELTKFFISLGGNPENINNLRADLNLSTFLLNPEGKVQRDEDFLSYLDGFKIHPTKAVAYNGNLKDMISTFLAFGRIFSKYPMVPAPPESLENIDDECIYINLDRMPKHHAQTLQRHVRRARGGNSHFIAPVAFDKVVFTLSLYNGQHRGQNLSKIKNSFLRLVDMNTQAELYRFNIPDLPDSSTGAIMLSLYQEGKEWILEANTEGCKGGLEALCIKYGLHVNGEEENKQ